MNEQPMVDLYTPAKRDEMTFGWLPDFVPADLVPDLANSAKLYHMDDLAVIMTNMDAGFVGLRRSTIDKTEALRQGIFYLMLTKMVGDEPVFAVYRRGSGSEGRLEGALSLGFGGHVDLGDLRYHTTFDELTGKFNAVEGVVSGFWSLLSNGVREFKEEVRVFRQRGEQVGEPIDEDPMQVDVVPRGFVSDYRPEQKGWVGNTHLGILGTAMVESEADFAMVESKYTRVGWMTVADLKEKQSEFENWSVLTIDVIDELVEELKAEQLTEAE